MGPVFAAGLFRKKKCTQEVMGMGSFWKQDWTKSRDRSWGKMLPIGTPTTLIQRLQDCIIRRSMTRKTKLTLLIFLQPQIDLHAFLVSIKQFAQWHSSLIGSAVAYVLNFKNPIGVRSYKHGHGFSSNGSSIGLSKRPLRSSKSTKHGQDSSAENCCGHGH